VEVFIDKPIGISLKKGVDLEVSSRNKPLFAFTGTAIQFILRICGTLVVPSPQLKFISSRVHPPPLIPHYKYTGIPNSIFPDVRYVRIAIATYEELGFMDVGIKYVVKLDCVTVFSRGMPSVRPTTVSLLLKKIGT
jgi:hypothetical protein